MLVVASPVGVVFDLLEFAHGTLRAAGLDAAQLFFVSPVAARAIACTSALSEWLSKHRLDKVAFCALLSNE